MLLLLIWRHSDYYIHGWEKQPERPSSPSADLATSMRKTTLTPTEVPNATPALSESQGGWGFGLFSSLRRSKAEQPTAKAGRDMGASLLGASIVGAGSINNRPGLGISTYGRSALGKSPEERQADNFRVSVAALLIPTLETFEGIQFVSFFSLSCFRLFFDTPCSLTIFRSWTFVHEGHTLELS